jgi:imidazolonepropionase
MTVHLFHNAPIHTPRDTGEPARGIQQAELVCYPQGAMVVEDGIITAIGHASDVMPALENAAIDVETDCQGRCLIPGLVDPHTHMCFARLREAEFAMRLQGTPYMDILKQGGGILSSVQAVAETEEAALLESTLAQARRALRLGTTTLEIKSGYGLDTENELKMLRVIDAVRRHTPLGCGGHFSRGARGAPGIQRRSGCLCGPGGPRDAARCGRSGHRPLLRCLL